MHHLHIFEYMFCILLKYLPTCKILIIVQFRINIILNNIYFKFISDMMAMYSSFHTENRMFIRWILYFIFFLGYDFFLFRL